MDHDPLSVLFPGQDSVDLYSVLSLSQDANTEQIKKSYRRLALIHHPDKHQSASDSARADASTRFQQISFAYAVLSDDVKRKRYDTTGRTDDGFDVGDDGWEAYFEQMFDRVTRVKLDELKKEYQGSSEEVEDLKSAYVQTGGSFADIITYIPHSTHDDEARFILIISDLIAKGELSSLPSWNSSINDKKASLVRKKQAQKEALEAENLAKELGVWDEFYGSGNTGDRKGRGKGKGKDKSSSKNNLDQEHDVAALQALIHKKNQKTNLDGFFDSLAAKYADPEPSANQKRKRTKQSSSSVQEVPSPRKKSKEDPPQINDDEFQKLQEKLFGDKPAKPSADGKSSKGKKPNRNPK